MVFKTVLGDLISQCICMLYKIYVITNQTGSVPQVRRSQEVVNVSHHHQMYLKYGLQSDPILYYLPLTLLFTSTATSSSCLLRRPHVSLSKISYCSVSVLIPLNLQYYGKYKMIFCQCVCPCMSACVHIPQLTMKPTSET